MKRIICIVCIVAGLLSAVSCGFVSYIPESSSDAVDNDLDTVKSEYILTLQQTFEKCVYSRDEEVQVRFLLRDATNEINECTSEDSIKIVYDKHFNRLKAVNEEAYIKSIPSLYKEYLMEPFLASLVLGNYLEAEQLQVSEIIKLFDDQMGEADTAERLEELFAQLRVALYSVPTSDRLAEETVEMKKQYDKLLKLYLLDSSTKTQHDKVSNAIDAYHEEASQILYDTKALTDLFLTYEEQIQAINAEVVTEPDVPSEEIETLVHKLTLSVNTAAFLTDSQRAEWLARASTAKEEMTAQDSLSDIRDIYFRYMKELYRDNDLDSYVGVLLNELSLYRSEQVYYDDDKLRVDEMKSGWKASILSSESFVNSDKALSSAKAQIDQVKSITDVWKDVLEEFRRELNERYDTDVLTEPSSMMLAQNYNELADIIDYYVFYQLNTETPSFVCDKFMVEIGFPHGTAEETVNIAYWYSELVKSAAGITGYFEGEDYLVIQLKPYSMAFYSNRDSYPDSPRLESKIDFDSDHSDMVSRSDTFDDFAYYKNTEQLEGIWNTQQLWYALENGYVPICVPDSPADKTLNRAKEILREIICEGMTDEEKIFRIYTWIGRNVQYDRQYYSYNTGLEDKVNYPDEKIAEMICFHAEGALLENLSVCYSFAKAYLILLRLEGIESYLCIGRTNAETQKNETISLTHAFVKIRLDGKWYTSDPQRSSLEVWTEGDVELPSYLRFLIPVNDLKHIVYTHNDIDMSNAGDYFIYDKLLLNGKKVMVDNVDDIRALISELEEGHTVSFFVKKELCSKVEALLAEYPQYRSKRNKTYDYSNTEIAEYYVYH